jgi:hypothetical protein
MRKGAWLVLLVVPFLGVRAADWAEVSAPGRAAGGVLDGTASGAGERSVEALVAFDGRLYPVLQPSAGSNRQAIVSVDPDKMDLRTENQTVAIRFGRFRILDGRLYAPVAEPAEDAGGYYVTAGGGTWDWVPVAGSGAAFSDVTRFDGKTLLAGRQKDRAIVAWRADGEAAWHIEPLNDEAARFSYRAASFLSVSNHLVLLAVRDVIGDWPLQVAPRDWGAWYVLAYTGGKGARGFLFDGPARPLPALRALAPESSLLQNPRYAVCRDVTWAGGLLYTVQREADKGADPAGGLFAATLKEDWPQAGRTFVGRRIARMGKARDIAVSGDTCAVLLGEDARPAAEIAVSTDLENWKTLFNGELPGTPLSLAVMKGRYYIGLDNGAIILVTKP